MHRALQHKAIGLRMHAARPSVWVGRCKVQCVHACAQLQVYRATLRSTGEEVAVKVQRPGIGESIAVDMLLLR